MARIRIPVSYLEFEEDGNTIWIHDKTGTATVLRLMTRSSGKIVTTRCESNPCSHVDAVTDYQIVVCLAGDVEDE
mgnify:CR=1 FL=1